MAWVIGATLFGFAVVFAGAFVTKQAVNVAAPAASTAVSMAGNDQNAGGPAEYYVDMLFRPGANASGGAAPQANQQPLSEAQRSEVTRVLFNSATTGTLTDADRDYLAGLVAQRTGLSQQEAAQRVTQVEQQAAQKTKEAADAARKAGAYVSFWSFMALLFGAMAATLAGILGGELRDEI